MNFKPLYIYPNDNVCSNACSQKATVDFLGTRVSKCSILSAFVGRAKGPRLTWANISAQRLLCVMVTQKSMLILRVVTRIDLNQTNSHHAQKKLTRAGWAPSRA